eukprot:Skav208675  [mRNA]  locus=scaffold775:155536:162033:+ [translate_table: standard]
MDDRLFHEYYETPPQFQLPRRSLRQSESLPQLPTRPTIGGIEDAKQVIQRERGRSQAPPPRNIFHATAVYRDACKRNKVQVLETLPLDWQAAGRANEVTWE